MLKLKEKRPLLDNHKKNNTDMRVECEERAREFFSGSILVDCIALRLVITINLVSSLCYNNFTNLGACQLVWKHLDTTLYNQLKRKKNVNPTLVRNWKQRILFCTGHAKGKQTKGKALGDDYSTLCDI